MGVSECHKHYNKYQNINKRRFYYEKTKQYRNSADMSEILSRTEFIYSKDYGKAQHEYQIVAVYKKCDKSRNARTDRACLSDFLSTDSRYSARGKARKGRVR